MTKPASTAKSDITLIRRERIASLLARNLTQREITAALAKPTHEGGMVNPDTNEPYDLATINRDIQALRKQHRESAAASMEEHQARQFAELQELKRFAWSQKDGALALRCLEREAKLLGLDAPIRQDVTTNGERISTPTIFLPTVEPDG